MGLSRGRVEARFEILGDDKSAKTLKASRDNFRDVQSEIERAGDKSEQFGKQFAEAGDDVATRSGKAATALSSLGDFAGDLEGPFRTASEAAGAFDDVLTLLPGPLGLAAAATAGLATAAFFVGRQLAQTRAAIDQVFGPGARRQIGEFADAVGVSREVAVELKLAFQDLDKDALQPTTAELRRVREAAEAVGGDGAEAVKKYAEALAGGLDAVRDFAKESKALRPADFKFDASALAKELAINAKNLQSKKAAVATDVQIVKLAKDRQLLNKRVGDLLFDNLRRGQEIAKLSTSRQIVERNVLRAQNDQQETAQRQVTIIDEQIQRLSLRLDLERESERAAKATNLAKFQQSSLDAQAALQSDKAFASRIRIAGVDNAIAATTRQIATARRLAAESATAENVQAVANLELQRLQLRVQAKAIEDAERARRRAAAARARARRQAAAAQTAKTEAETRRLAADNLRFLIGAEKSRLEAIQLGARARLAEEKALGASVATVANIEREAARAKFARDVFALEQLRNKILPSEHAARLQALRTLHSAELIEIDKRVEAEGKKKSDAAKKQAREAFDVSVASFKEAAAATKGEDVGSQIFSGLSSSIGEAVEQFGKVKKAGPGAFSAIGKAGAAAIDNERARAGILAITSTADAIRAGAQGNIPAAIGFGLAAAQYGLVAGGVLGGTGAGATRGAAAGAGRPAFAAGPEGDGDGAARQVNITFNGVFTTQAQVGAGMKEAQMSLEGTGI